MNQVEVVLVDASDCELGVMEKMEAHVKGVLHRAFSVFIYNSQGQMLLQQRADNKYHSAGLWTNACCSHPFPGEELLDAANRRLSEEMGMTADLLPSFSFIYKAELGNGLTEHEFDHVFVGTTDLLPVINPSEVKSYRWVSEEQIQKEINSAPEHFTAWFLIAFPMLLSEKSKLI
jgi:isopentenyl-diphosphate delta-isomerase